jgi:hypothetical protein
MSYELGVYSTDPPLVDEAEIRQGMEAVGFELLFLRDGSLEDLRPVAFAEAQVAMGIPRGKHHEEVSRAVAAADGAALQRLYKKSRVALVELYVDPVTEGMATKLEEVAANPSASPYGERIRRTRTVYTVRTSATRNRLSLRFQRGLWASIGVATQGVLEDEEADEYLDIPP